jgi:hypothetical protein
VTLREIATELAKTLPCNCDLDNWAPENTTGHSWVCRIHKAALAQADGRPTLKHLFDKARTEMGEETYRRFLRELAGEKP